MWPAEMTRMWWPTEVSDGTESRSKRPTGKWRKLADVAGGHGAVDGSMAVDCGWPGPSLLIELEETLSMGG